MGRSGVGESANIHAALAPQGFSMEFNLNPAMNSLPSIALSGMQAAQAAMNATAHNVAAFVANLAVFHTADRLAGAVLDTYA